MKNSTLRADEKLIKQAQLAARSRHTTLNTAFREWLAQYTAQAEPGIAIDRLMHSLKHIHSSGPYTRNEMNER